MSSDSWQSDLVEKLLCFRTQIKVFHWQTSSYAQHKALDKLTGALDSLGDKLVEVSIGHSHTKPRVSQDCVDLINLPDEGAGSVPEDYVRKVIHPFLVSLLRAPETAESMKPVVEELLAEVDRTLYLLDLH